jgi:hypothetical protein
VTFDLVGFVAAHFGQRCSIYEPGCACCETWRFADASHTALARAIDTFAKEYATIEVKRAYDRSDRLAGD